jgi:hypothetical protein
MKPIPKATRMEVAPHSKLGSCVAATDAAHHATASCAIDDVRHDQTIAASSLSSKSATVPS